MWASTLLEELREAQSLDAKRRGLMGYQTPGSMVMELMTSIGELADIFQWKDEAGSRSVSGWNSRDRRQLNESMSDVLLSLIRLSDVCETDLGSVARSRISKVAHKYPAYTVPGAPHEMDHSGMSATHPVSAHDPPPASYSRQRTHSAHSAHHHASREGRHSPPPHSRTGSPDRSSRYRKSSSRRSPRGERDVYCPVFPPSGRDRRAEVVCPLLPEHALRVHHKSRRDQSYVQERNGVPTKQSKAHSLLCASNSGSSSATHSTVWSIAPSPPMSPLTNERVRARDIPGVVDLPPATSQVAQPAPAAAQRRARPRLRRTLTVTLPKASWQAEQHTNELYSPTHFQKDLFSPAAAKNELTFDDSILPPAITAVQRNREREKEVRDSEAETEPPRVQQRGTRTHSPPKAGCASSPSSTTSLGRALPGRTNSAFAHRDPPDAKVETPTVPPPLPATLQPVQKQAAKQVAVVPAASVPVLPKKAVSDRGAIRVPNSPARSDTSERSALSDFNGNIIAWIEGSDWTEVCPAASPSGGAAGVCMSTLRFPTATHRSPSSTRCMCASAFLSTARSMISCQTGGTSRFCSRVSLNTWPLRSTS